MAIVEGFPDKLEIIDPGPRTFEQFCELLNIGTWKRPLEDYEHRPKLTTVKFEPYAHQLRLAKLYDEHQHVITCKYRQGGFSTLNLAWALHKFFYEEDKSIIFVTRSDREAMELSFIATQMIASLPMWMKGGIDANNHEIRRAENTLIFRSPRPCLGKSATHLFIEEAAFIEDMDLCWRALWPVACRGRIFVTSTANKRDQWFYKTYKDALSGLNSFHANLVHYLETPKFQDEEFVKKMKENLGMKAWQLEMLGEFRD